MKNRASGFEQRKKAFEKVDGLIKIDDKTLKKLQSVLFEMLRDFVNTAEKNNLNYSLGGGSVLGAVRHHGFIPWDDDIDLNMPRKDFEKFKKVFKKSMSDKYDLYAPELGCDHGMMVCQIKKKNTLYRSYNELSKKDPGICIDIFVVENAPDNKISRNLHGIHCLASGYFLTSKKTWNDLPYLKKYFDNNKELEAQFSKKLKVGKLFKNKSLDEMSKKTERIYSKCQNDHSKYVTIPSGQKHYFGEMYKRESLCTYEKMLFNDLYVNVPKDWDGYLRNLYGDTYMELPPVEKREVHPIMELCFDTKKTIE